jgi:hypothetical protein
MGNWGIVMDITEGQYTLASRARQATLASWAVIVATVLTLAFEVAESIGKFDPASASGTVLLSYALVGIGYTIAFIVSIILVARWIRRAHANLHETETQALEFTPGWAVGWYFIPFANLVKPFQAMRELWNGSTTPGDISAPAPGLLTAWWTTWIVGNILANISMRLTFREDPELYALSAPIGAVSSVLIIACAWLLIRIIRQITEAQSSGLYVAEVFA